MSSTIQQSLIYKEQNSAMATDQLQRRALDAKNNELRKVSQEFESIFIKIMLDSMRSTLSDEGLIQKNSGQKLFEDELYSEYAKSISLTANLGIADMIYNQLDSSIPGNKIDIQG